MKKAWLPLFFLLLVSGLVFCDPARAKPSTAAVAQDTETPKLTPAPTTPLAPLATQLGQTLQTLVSPPQETSATTPTESIDDFAVQISETFATGIFNSLIKGVGKLKANSSILKAHATAFQDLSDWVNLQSGDQRRAVLWGTIGEDLLTIVAPSILIGIAFFLFFIPLRNRLRNRRQPSLSGRISLLLILLFLRLLPAVIFLGISLFLLEQNESHRLPRFVILNVTYALSLGYAIQQALRGLFSPNTPHIRTVPMETPQAVSTYRWLSSFCFVIVYSYFLIDVAEALHVPTSVSILFQSFFALIVSTMMMGAIVRTRSFVAGFLRGQPAEDESPGVVNASRLWLAKHWHRLAMAYIAISLAITLAGVENSFALMLRGTFLSVVTLVATRFIYLAIDKWKKGTQVGTPLTHRVILSFFLRLGLWGVALTAIAATWGVDVQNMLATPFGQRLLNAVISISLTLFILTVLYEMIHRGIDRHLSRHDKTTKLPLASARARTLLPMVRASIFILFSVIALLTCLSAIGINIAPLLAGAGVVGVAIGFGSQTLIKDFLTGLFIVAENSIALGDNVRIDNYEGVVEELSIRTIRIRDLEGSLHILPFSEVSKITNMSRGFAYALVDVGVAYSSDLTKVMNVLRDVGQSIQEDPVFKRVILEPIKIMGVQSFESSSIVLRARIRTRPGKQWDVRRLLLLRIKQGFDREGIEIPFPTVKQIRVPESNIIKE